MALRNLVAKLRSPVAAALRLPPPAPRAGARPMFYSSAKGKDLYRPKINIQTASREELLHEAGSVRAEIDEIWESVSTHREKIPMVWQNLRSTGKLMIASAVLTSAIEFATYEDDALDESNE